MPQVQDMSSLENAYDAKTLAKMHRISIEDAAKIVVEYGADPQGLRSGLAALCSLSISRGEHVS